MELKMIIDAVQDYGYLALFFFLWLGVVGMPVPDEAIVMSGGFVTSTGLLSTVGAFLVTYAGVVSGVSLGYVLGRFVGKPAIDYLSRKKKLNLYIRKSTDLFEKYGKAALMVSYFIPMVRHIVPYLVGIHKMPFFQYAFYSYTTGFIWTLFWFLTGKFFGKHIMVIAEGLQDNRVIAMLILSGLPLLVIVVRKSKKPLNNH